MLQTPQLDELKTFRVSFVAIERSRIAQRDIDDVIGRRTAALRDVEDVVRRTHQIFREQKSRGQFAIMTRRAHDHGDAVALDANFERLLRGRAVWTIVKLARFVARNRNFPAGRRSHGA